VIPPPPKGSTVVATAPTATTPPKVKVNPGSIPTVKEVAAACAPLAPFNHVLAGAPTRIAGLQAVLPVTISQLTSFVSRQAPAQSGLRSQQLRARSVLTQLQVVSTALDAYAKSQSAANRSRLKASLDAESATARAETLPECALAAS
jgi:hypothetical protein